MHLFWISDMLGYLPCMVTFHWMVSHPSTSRDHSCLSEWGSLVLCQSTHLSPLQPGFNPWAGMWESSLLSLRMSGGFPSGFLPPPERFKISSYKSVRVGRVLDLHSGDVKHTFIFFLLSSVIHWELVKLHY